MKSHARPPKIHTRPACIHRCVLSSAMGSYLRSRRGMSTDGLEVTVGLPVSLHPPILPANIGNTAGNKFGFLMVRLPLYEFGSREVRRHGLERASPPAVHGHLSGRLLSCAWHVRVRAQARLAEIHERLAVAKSWPEALHQSRAHSAHSSPWHLPCIPCIPCAPPTSRLSRCARQALVSNALATATGFLPDELLQCALGTAGSSRASTIMSNVRGPPDALHIGGLRLSSLYGFLPTPPGVALGLGFGTYAGQIALSIVCDRGLLGDDSGTLLRMMCDEHAAFCASASATHLI